MSSQTSLFEEWLPVVGYEQYYEVSSFGRVRSLDRVVDAKLGRTYLKQGRMLKQPTSAGYPAVSLYSKGLKALGHVHVLVAAAFIGPRPPGLDVCHWDDDRTNNAAGNLRYATRAENIADAVRNGGGQNGENNPVAKLTEEDVRLARILRSDGVSYRDLAKRFGVTRGGITSAITGRTWGWLT